MSDQCILAIELTGGLTDEHVQNPEVSHALERCSRRIHLAVSAQGGTELSCTRSTYSFSFEDCDKAVLAAGEILERLASIPPIGGTRVNAKLGLHLKTDTDTDRDIAEIALVLAEFAPLNQALISEPALKALTAPILSFAGSERIRPREELEKFGWAVYSVCKRAGMVTSIVSPSRLSPRLRVRHRQNVILVEDQRPVLLIGREMGNDLVVSDPRASRQHARIELQQTGFVLIDESSNGTYVSINGASEYNVKSGAFSLEGSGQIGCGFSVNEAEDNIIYFEAA